MGIHPNISIDKFPRQGKFLNRRVTVCFNFDPSRTIGGKIVRDDTEEPGMLIIALDNGRFVLATECQYSFEKAEDGTEAKHEPTGN